MKKALLLTLVIVLISSLSSCVKSAAKEYEKRGSGSTWQTTTEQPKPIASNSDFDLAGQIEQDLNEASNELREFIDKGGVEDLLNDFSSAFGIEIHISVNGEEDEQMEHQNE